MSKTVRVKPYSQELKYESSARVFRKLIWASRFHWLQLITLQILQQSKSWSWICCFCSPRALPRNLLVAISLKAYGSAIPEIFSRLASQILIVAKWIADGLLRHLLAQHCNSNARTLICPWWVMGCDAIRPLSNSIALWQDQTEPWCRYQFIFLSLQSLNCANDRILVSREGRPALAGALAYCGTQGFTVESTGNRIVIALRTLISSTGGRFLCRLSVLQPCQCGIRNSVSWLLPSPCSVAIKLG